METIIKKATLNDLKYIESLSKTETKSIGFIPKVRYEAAIIGQRVHEKTQPKCNDTIYLCFENDDPVGFVLGSKGKGVDGFSKVSQIVIQPDARLIERGKLLLNGIITHYESMGIFDFRCGCADDLESNFFWKAMGWDKIAQRKGIAYTNTYKETSDRDINIYIFTSPNNPQLRLFGNHTVKEAETEIPTPERYE